MIFLQINLKFKITKSIYLIHVESYDMNILEIHNVYWDTYVWNIYIIETRKNDSKKNYYKII